MGRDRPFPGARCTGTGTAAGTGAGSTEAEAQGSEKVVLFGSCKPLKRAENIRAVYHAYDGPKKFVQLDPWRRNPEIISGKYNLLVIDEFPTVSPGKIIAIGHGIAGGKTSGLEQPTPYVRKEQAVLITYAITSSPDMVPLVARYSGLDEKQVLPLGMPRTDAYIGAHVATSTKRTYLYAPTYRSPAETPMPEIDWRWLDDNLTDDEQIIVKPHTMTGHILPKDKWKHIREVQADEPSAHYLHLCSVLVTDYSSILFDAYLMGKPGVLFEKQKGYTETRGMYLDYPAQYCSRYCTEEKTLLSMLREADGLTRTERDCIRLVAAACDGHACERICDLIRSLL